MDLILSALIVMLVGMGFVFGFLIIQVGVTQLCAKFAQKYSYLLPEPNKTVRRAAPAAAAANDGEIVAVVAAALRQEGKLPL